jgi:beta-barrel assembly-enhancing protease
MKWVPRAADGDVNRPKEHPLVNFGVLAIGMLALIAISTAVFGFFVNIALGFVSEEDERRVLGSIAPQIRKSLGGDTHAGATAAIAPLAHRAMNVRGYGTEDLRVFVVCSELPNAFAVPGGEIVVTSSLLHALETEDELMFILGHEIGHFEHRDHLRSLGRRVLAAIFWSAIFTSSSVDSDLLSGTVLDTAARGHDRGQEIAADGVGGAVLDATYGHVQAAERVMKTLGALSDEGWVERIDFSRTHPVSSARIGNLQQTAKVRGWSVEGTSPPLNEALRSACKSPSSS